MKIILRIFLIITLFISTSQASAQIKDYWLKTERKGKGYAYDHITVTEMANGHFLYTSEKHGKRKLLGYKQEEIIKSRYIVDKDLIPVSFDYQANYKIKKVHNKGKYSNGVMQIEIEDENGEITKKEIPMQDTYFHSVLGDLIVKRKDEKKFKIKLFNPESFRIYNPRVKIIKSDKDEIKAKLRKDKYSFDSQGRIKEISSAIRRSYQTDEEDAKNINYLIMDDGYILTQKTEKSFPNVNKVKEAHLKMS